VAALAVTESASDPAPTAAIVMKSRREGLVFSVIPVSL
jgi:hypothetical protein